MFLSVASGGRIAGRPQGSPNTHQPKTPARDSVGAKVVRSGGVGLYGRPSDPRTSEIVVVPGMALAVDYAGGHKGPLPISSSLPPLRMVMNFAFGL